MEQEHLFQGTGWGAVSQELGPPGQYESHKHITGREEDDSAPNSPAAGAGPPPDLVAAFLQSHRSNAAASTVPHVADEEPSHRVPSVLRSSSINSDVDGDSLTLPNPFAVGNSNSKGGNSHYPPLPQFQQQQEQQQQQRQGQKKHLVVVKGVVAPVQQQQQQGKKKRSFLQRLFRGLMITGASAGLMALGAWGGSLAYRHYMAQLDDRDQLARRVADLHKQEDKLVLRCTALEQDRQNLAASLSDASTALQDGAAARSKLQQQLTHANADREEAVRLNLNLQRKLTSLEEQHSALSASHKEKAQALDLTLAEAARLDKEVAKLLGSVEKLESRCGALEAANVELKRDNAALTAAQQKNRTHKC